MIAIIVSIFVICSVVYLIIKKFDPILVLTLGGLILLATAALLGYPILPAKQSTEYLFLDIFKNIELLFLTNLGNIGLTIMTLFGYAAYMTHIGANDVTIHWLTKPLSKIRSTYFLIPIIFILGNLMSLVVPSASSLAVLLMATLYPILTQLEISPLAAGGVIATTATIMPTPLGADNVIAAETFHMNIMTYVTHHAYISLPSILIMAIAHYIWQKHLDKTDVTTSHIHMDASKLQLEDKALEPMYYGIFPILPLLLVIVVNLCFPNIKIGLVTLSFMSLIFTICVDSLRRRNIQYVTQSLQSCFKGMGNGLSSVVVLLVAAGLFVAGLKSLGIIKMLMGVITSSQHAGVLVPLAFSAIVASIGLISGSGLAVFYGTINIIPDLAQAANIPPQAISLPIQMMANLIRSISPVSAVIVIVATTMKVSPTQIIKRTSVPIIAGMLSVLILTYLTLL